MTIRVKPPKAVWVTLAEDGRKVFWWGVRRPRTGSHHFTVQRYVLPSTPPTEAEVLAMAKRLHRAGEWVEPWREAAQPAFLLMARFALDPGGSHARREEVTYG